MPNDSPSFGLKLRFNGKPGIYRCTWSTWWPLVSCTMSSSWVWVNEISFQLQKVDFFWKANQSTDDPTLTFKHNEFGWILEVGKTWTQRWFCGSVGVFFTVWVGVAVGHPFWICGFLGWRPTVGQFYPSKDPKGSERIQLLFSPLPEKMIQFD